MKTELEWGETPWDDLSREELLREVQRMYLALVKLYSFAHQHRHYDPNSPYWGLEGAGGAAWEMARQILEPLEVQHESMYRCFFRYAPDLLFDANGYKLIGHGWVTCSKCGVMLGNPDRIGKPCEHGDKDCDGVFRKLEWADLQPKANELEA